MGYGVKSCKYRFITGTQIFLPSGRFLVFHKSTTTTTTTKSDENETNIYAQLKLKKRSTKENTTKKEF